MKVLFSQIMADKGRHTKQHILVFIWPKFGINWPFGGTFSNEKIKRSNIALSNTFTAHMKSELYCVLLNDPKQGKLIVGSLLLC